MRNAQDLFPDPARWEPTVSLASDWEDDEFGWTEEPELDPTRPSDKELIASPPKPMEKHRETRRSGRRL